MEGKKKGRRETGKQAGKKMTNAQRVGRVTQVVEHLPTKYKAKFNLQDCQRGEKKNSGQNHTRFLPCTFFD
jgi:hypothetical protein